MMTQEDIQKLMEVFATKDEIKEAIESVSAGETLDKLDFEIANIMKRMFAKKDTNSLSAKINDLRLLIDNYSKKADMYYQKILKMNQEFNR